MENPNNRPASVDEYIQLLNRVPLFTERIQSVPLTDPDATERISSLQRGISALDQRIEALGADTEVTAYMLSEQKRAQNALEDLSLMEDLLDPAEVEQEKTKYSETLNFVTAFTIRHALGEVQITPVIINEVTATEAPTLPQEIVPETVVPPMVQPAPEVIIEEPVDAEVDAEPSIPALAIEEAIDLPAPEIAASPERQKRDAVLTLVQTGDTTFLRIGKRRIPLAPRRSAEDLTDYTEARKAALRFVVSKNGEAFTAMEMFDAIGLGGTVSEFFNAKQSVRSWLTSISWDNQPVVLHNLKRGRGSMYSVNPNMNVSLVETVTQHRQRPLLEMTVIDGAVSEITEPVIEEIPTVTAIGDATPEQAVEIIKESGLSFSLREAAVLIEFLRYNSSYLDGYGMKIPVGDAMDAIIQASNDYDNANGISRAGSQDQIVLDERNEVVNSFRLAFEVDVLFDEIMNSITLDDVRYPLLEYLMDINGEEEWLIVDQLLSGKQKQIILYDGDKKTRDVVGVETRVVYNGEDAIDLVKCIGERIIRISGLTDIVAYDADEYEQSGDKATPVGVIATDSPEPMQPIVVEDLDLFEQGVPLTSIADNENEIPIARSSAERRESTEILSDAMNERLNQIRDMYIEGNAEGSKPPGQSNVRHMNNYFTWMQPRLLREARENSIIGEVSKRSMRAHARGSGSQITLEQIVRMGMWHADPNSYGLRMNAKAIEKAVASVVEKILAARPDLR